MTTARRDLTAELRSLRASQERQKQAEAEQARRDKFTGVAVVVVLTLTWVGTLIVIAHRMLGG